MKVIYARISTPSQKFDRQLQSEYDRVYLDTCSGVERFEDREHARKLLNAEDVKSFEVAEVSRLGRNTSDVLKTLETFTAKGVNIHIKNIGLDTMIGEKPNPIAEMIIAVLGAIAKQERDAINERTQQGREIAKAKGNVYKGRKRGAVSTTEKLAKKHASTIKEANELRSKGFSINRINEKLKEANEKITDKNKKYTGVNRTTLMKLLDLGLIN